MQNNFLNVSTSLNVTGVYNKLRYLIIDQRHPDHRYPEHCHPEKPALSEAEVESKG